jgi:hypothetical protein
LPGSPTAQPATPSTPYGARPAPRRGVRAARRGWALVRTIVLVALTGLLIAVVVATIFAGLIIAINGALPK